MPASLVAGKPTTLTVVNDATNRPVAGATVSRLAAGEEAAAAEPVGVTDADGRLTIDVDPAQRSAYVAEAPALAPQLFGFYGAMPNAREIRLHIPVIRRGVVLKPDGTPAAGAVVELANTKIDVGPRMDDRELAPFSWLRSIRADDAGRFAFVVDPMHPWKRSAMLRARDEAGHVAVFDLTLARDPATSAALEDGSFRVQLAKPPAKKAEPEKSPWPVAPTRRAEAALSLRIKVVDDETGQPITAIRVTPGSVSSPDQSPHFLYDESLAFADEPIEWTFYDEAWAYAALVEATGYAKTPTRLVKASEKSADVEVRLRKPVKLALTLKDPDGKPAAGARVFLATPTQNARVPLLETNPATARVVATSGAEGIAMIDLPGEPCRAAVVHDNGWAEIDLTKGDNARRDVTLSRWASVSVAVGDGQPLGGVVFVQSQTFYTTDAGCEINWTGLGWTDERGVFVQPHCRGDAPLLVYFNVPHLPLNPTQRLPAHFEVQTTNPLASGEHRDYRVLGGRGGFKAALFDVPGKKWTWVSLERVIENGQPAPPAPPAGQPRPISPRGITLEVSTNGEIACDGLRPAKYAVRARATSGRSDRSPIIATGEFTIGEDEAKVDLGVLKLKEAEKPAFAIGDAAPELKSTTLDGKPFDLASLRGKWVLLDFWGTWCGFCIAEEPTYRDAFEGWGVDGRLTMVSLAVDDTPEQVREHLKTHDLPWTHLVLGKKEETDIPQKFGVVGYPTVLLISPEGKLVATNLRGGTLRETLIKHLGPAAAPRK